MALSKSSQKRRSAVVAGFRPMCATSLAALAALVIGSRSAKAATYYWDPSQTGANPGSGGTGTWNTTLTYWNPATTPGTGDVAFPSGSVADFAGSAGTVTLGSAITAGGLIFDTAGYTLATSTFTLSLGGNLTTTNTSGATTITGAVAGTTSSTWSVAAGGTLQFNAAYTNASSSNVFQLTSNGTTNITNTFSVTGKATLTGTTGGIINLSGTESFETSAGDYSGVAGVTVNNTAGTATFTPGTSNAFFIGNTGTTVTSTLNVTGGTAQVTNATRIYIGDGFNGAATAGDGTLTVGGGAGAAVFTTSTATNGTAGFILGNSVATGTINLLTNGTLSTARTMAQGAAGKGILNFNGGTLQATAATLTDTLVNNVQDNGGIINSAGFAITIAGNFNHGGTAATDGGLTLTGGSLTLSGIINNTGGLVWNGGGTITGNNTYTGATLVNAFVDAKTSGNVFGATGTGNYTQINSGGTVRFRDSTLTIGEAFVLNGGSFILLNNPGTTTFNGQFTLDTSSVIQLQPAGQTSTVTNFNGAFVEGGTASNLYLVRSAAPTNLASADIFNLTGSSTYGGNTYISDVATTATGIFSVKASGGDNRLPTGTTVVLGGLNSGNGAAAGNGQLILGDATTGAISQTLAGLTVTGTGTKNSVIGGSTTISTLGLNISSSDTYAGLLGGAGTNANNLGLNKSGNGYLIINNANTYTGPTTVSAGALIAQSTTNTPLSTSAVTVLAGGNVSVGDHAGSVPNMTNSFVLNGAGKSVNASPVTDITTGIGALQFFNSGNFSVTGPVTLASDSLIFSNPVTQTGAVSFTGMISGSGGLALAGGSSGSGTPTFVLSAANTYGTSNASTLLTNKGTTQTYVELSTNNNVLPSGTVLTFGGTPTGQAGSYNGPVTMRLDGISQTVAGLTTGGSGAYAIVGNSATASTLTVNNSANYTYGGTIGSAATNGNNVALVKSGANSLTVSGANTYAGGTTLSTGTLATSGSGSLGTGNVTIAAGTILTLGNNVSIGDGATLTFDDSATINLNGGVTAEVLNTLTDGLITLNTGTYTAAQLDTAFGGISTFQGTGSVALPEPASLSMLGLGAAGLLGRRRRRRTA